jgi:hypothetical protein
MKNGNSLAHKMGFVGLLIFLEGIAIPSKPIIMGFGACVFGIVVLYFLRIIADNSKE